MLVFIKLRCNVVELFLYEEMFYYEDYGGRLVLDILGFSFDLKFIIFICKMGDNNIICFRGRELNEIIRVKFLV